MPVISRITTQQNNKERYNIFLWKAGKETYGFSVDEDILVAYHLHKGLELDAALMDELTEKDSEQKAYNMAIHYLSYRMRTEKEIADYLERKEIEGMHVATVMKKLSQKGFIDDLEFANSFVSSRINTSMKGPEIIKRELLEKGVHEDSIIKALKQYTYQEQYDKAEKLLQKKINSSTKKSHQQIVEGARTHLMQKGFTQEVVKDVAAADSFARDDQAEWQALIHHGTKQLRKFRSKYDGHKLQNKLKESLYRKGFPFPLIQTFLEIYVTNAESNEHFD